MMNPYKSPFSYGFPMVFQPGQCWWVDPTNGSYVDGFQWVFIGFSHEEIGGFYWILMDLGKNQMGKYLGNIMGIFFFIIYVNYVVYWIFDDIWYIMRTVWE